LKITVNITKIKELDHSFLISFCQYESRKISMILVIMFLFFSFLLLHLMGHGEPKRHPVQRNLGWLQRGLKKREKKATKQERLQLEILRAEWSHSRAFIPTPITFAALNGAWRAKKASGTAESGLAAAWIIVS
jgi:hypothetical protein